MANEDCPCKYCVAPKRHPGCHADCDEYKKWDIKHQQELVKIREKNRAENDCFPNRLRNGIKRRRR
jgi:hypothetical protein